MGTVSAVQFVRLLPDGTLSPLLCPGRYGALGLGDFENRSTPMVVQSLGGVVGRQICCGDDHTVLLASDGTTYAWGRGVFGQTGQGHTDNVCRPQLVRGALQGQHIVQVAAGGRHTLCLTASNQVYAFGCNDSGQLAAPPCDSQPTPLLVPGLPPSSPILFVAAGGDTSAVVSDSGSTVHPDAVGECCCWIFSEAVLCGPCHARNSIFA